jgi:hypothetical protein
MSAATASRPKQWARPIWRPPDVRLTLEQLWPPVAAFLLACLGLWVATTSAGDPFFRSASWSRFDSDYYMQGAQIGYGLFHCPAPHGAEWCGDSGWFPGYSLLAWPFVHAGLPARSTELAISLLFCLATLALLWMAVLGARATPGNLVCLGFAAFTPGQVYDHSVFPLAMASFFVVLAIVFLRRRRWALAGFAGAGATLSYPTACALVAAMAIGVLAADRSTPLARRARRALATGGLTAIGLALVLLVDQLETGSWNAYFRVQAHYHHALRDPFVAWVDAVTPLTHNHPGLHAVPAIEAGFVAVVLVVLLVHALLRASRLTVVEVTVLAFALAVWLLPLSLRTSDIYRSDALLLPTALLVRRLPPSIGVILVVAAAMLSVPMGMAFLQRVLG